MNRVVSVRRIKEIPCWRRFSLIAEKPNMKNSIDRQPMERTLSDKACENSRAGSLPLVSLQPGLGFTMMETLPYSPVILRHPKKALFPGNGDIFFSVSGGYRDRDKAGKMHWSAKGEVILEIRKPSQPPFSQQPSLSRRREGLTITRWTPLPPEDHSLGNDTSNTFYEEDRYGPNRLQPTEREARNH